MSENENAIRIALAGNPNCGKTTLFNALTGSNQYVGNWPGVTVEKKEGKAKKNPGVIITDLPGIYSLSPYTLEEVVARNYLIDERPQAILNIIDGTNLERNLYLTTQLIEVGIPTVIAVNMMDLVKKNGDVIDLDALSQVLKCPVYPISALKNEGIEEVLKAAVEAAKSNKSVPEHHFSGATEHALAHIEEAVVHSLPDEQQRFYAIKLFERDEKIYEKLQISEETKQHIENDIVSCEKEMDDDAEAIITNERYTLIADIIRQCYKKKHTGQKLSVSDKIDKVVTNRWAGLPIFIAVMFIVYYIAISTIGTFVTDFTNDQLLGGDGWFLLGIGRGKYDEAAGDYEDATIGIDAFYSLEEVDMEADDFDSTAFIATLKAYYLAHAGSAPVEYELEDEETLDKSTVLVYYDSVPEDAPENAHGVSFKEAIDYFEENGFDEPDPSNYGPYILGLQAAVGNWMTDLGAADWAISLVCDGIIGGIAAPLGFAPQMAIVFLLLSILEDCGYMARVAFVMDRIFRSFGLSGRSFIPFMISSGCGVPGIMATRTIENEKDRRMTMLTTTWIPCGAKLPVIACVAAYIGHAWWIAPLVYFMAIAAVIIVCVILKKTKSFGGDPAAFVLELPAYHVPSVSNVLRHVWERVWAFLKKAGTVLFACCVVMWFLSSFGVQNGVFGLVEAENSFLYIIGNVISVIFIPLGFNSAGAVAATFSGFVAKEGIVSTIGVLTANTGLGTFFNGSALVAFSFLVFNMFDSPCLAAISTMAKEQHSGKWFAISLAIQNLFAYGLTLMIYQIVGLFMGEVAFNFWTVFAFLLLAGVLFLLFRPNPNKKKNKAAVAAAE